MFYFIQLYLWFSNFHVFMNHHVKMQILVRLVWARGRNSAFLTSQVCWSVDHTWSIKEIYFLEYSLSLFESVNMVFVLF